MLNILGYADDSYHAGHEVSALSRTMHLDKLLKSQKARAIVQKVSGSDQHAEKISSYSMPLAKRPNDKYKKAAKMVLQRMRKKD